MMHTENADQVRRNGAVTLLEQPNNLAAFHASQNCHYSLKSKLRALCSTYPKPSGIVKGGESLRERKWTPYRLRLDENEKSFWLNVLRMPANSSPPGKSTKDLVRNIAVDLALMQNEKVADRFVEQAQILTRMSNGEAVLEFLMELSRIVVEKRGRRSLIDFGFESIGASAPDKNLQFLRSANRALFSFSPDSSYQPPTTTETFNLLVGRKSTVNSAKDPEKPEPIKPDCSSKKPEPLPVKVYVGEILSTLQAQDYDDTTLTESTAEGVIWVLTPKQFLANIRKVFLGQESRLFEWDLDSETFRKVNNYVVEGLCPATIESILEVAIRNGTLIAGISDFLSHPLTNYVSHPGSTFLAFQAAVRTYLSSWSVHASGDLKDREGILETVSTMEAFGSSITTLSTICRDVGTRGAEGTPLRGLALLHCLYEFCRDCLHSEQVYHLVLFLLEESSKPFFHFATNLAFHGRFTDSRKEYEVKFDEAEGKDPSVHFWRDVLVMQNQNLTRQDVFLCTKADFSGREFSKAKLGNERFFVFAKSGSFLDDYLDNVVRCGRCLMLIRSITRFHPLLPQEQPGITGNNFMLGLSFSCNFQKERREFAERCNRIWNDILFSKLDKCDESKAYAKPTVKTDGAFTCSGAKRYKFDIFSQETSTLEDFPDVCNQNDQCFRAAVDRGLLPIISLQTELLDFAVVRMFLDTVRLKDHLHVIREFFFLENGEFSTLLVSGLYEKAAKFLLRDCMNHVTLLTIFDTSLAAADRRKNPALKNLSLTSTKWCDVKKGSTSYDVVDYLGLQYSIKWPMGLLLTEDLMDKCNSVFRFLLKLKGCVWAMNDAFVLLSDQQRIGNAEHRIALNVYRHEIGQVVRTLDEHFTDGTVHASWPRLKRTMKDANVFEDLQAGVAVYIESVHARCLFQANGKLNRSLSEILRYAIRFYQQLREESAFSDLQRTFELFQHCTQTFLAALKKRKTPTEFQADVCGTRLDFNGYIQKQIRKQQGKAMGKNPYGTL